MDKLLEGIIKHSRTVLLMLVFFLGAGAIAYVKLSKESNPDISIPYIFVSMEQTRISPEDA